jgi:3-isopropylmalate/(R)-2-methylmalate dehydratase small subunit
MQPFTTHTGIAVPLIKDDVNTDQIAPVQSMRSLKPDYKALLFMRARRRDDGSEDPDFVLNQPQFRNPGILVTGHNFGAGSSREAAVWGMLANNIRVIVAKSFADIYRENCLQNGLLPIVLEPRDGADISFDIPAADRMRLLEGLDDIGLTLKHADEIASWEQRTAADQPWLQAAVDRRL